MPIYTKTGDKGKTSLFGGKRVLKCSELVDVYGSIDELNSWVRYVATQLDVADVREFLFDVQRDLMTIASSLAGWDVKLTQQKKRVREMEVLIDTFDRELPKLSNFIVPGGSALGAMIHIVRGICRRVERQAVALSQKEPVDSMITLTILSVDRENLWLTY